MLDVAFDFRQLRVAAAGDLFVARCIRLPRHGGTRVTGLVMLNGAIDLQQLERLSIAPATEVQLGANLVEGPALRLSQHRSKGPSSLPAAGKRCE